MIVQCPNCKARLEAESNNFGTKVRCSECKTSFELSSSKAKKVEPVAENNKWKNFFRIRPQAKYKIPIISSIFHIFGIIILTGTILLSAIFIVAIMIDDERGKVTSLLFAVIFGGGFYSLICFGIAQVIEYFAKTAHYAEAISNQLADLNLRSVDDQLK